MIVIGLTGKANAGKSLVASMLPGFQSIGLADPLYAGLSAMLGVDVESLRDRATKEVAIPWLGRSPRELLQTLGTDWGRDLVAGDLWVTLCRRRIEEMAAGRVAICDLRFANEARMVRELGGQVWEILRPSGETTPHSHRSENGLPAELVDRVLINSGSIDDLAHAVDAAFAEAFRAAHA